MITKGFFWFWLLALAVVYIAGIFIPLMDSDSCQFAVMGMRIFQSGDYLHLYKGPNPYLDKPHMHYWLTAISYSIFGVSHWAYRLHGLLFLCLGALGTYKLAEMFYGNSGARLAALFFLSCQAVILMGHDLRTDTVLTGSSICAMWLLVSCFENEKWRDLLGGAFFLAFAFSTKGLIALVVCGLCFLAYVYHRNRWREFLRWRVWTIGMLVFMITSLPMLYAYYIQFGWEGVRFIFLDQSVERMSGGTWETESPEYTFFWHTILWACLPISLLVYIFWYLRLRKWVGEKWSRHTLPEYITTLGLLSVMLLISMSQFKLPHYLNVLMPYFSILVAGGLVQLGDREGVQLKRWMIGVQIGISAVALVVAMLIMVWVFPLSWWWVLCVMAAFGALWIYSLLVQQHWVTRLAQISIGAMVITNLVLNLHFYPKLLAYQAGMSISDYVKEWSIPVDDVRKFDHRSWTWDFYSGKWQKQINSSQELTNQLEHSGSLYLIVKEDDIDRMPNDLSYKIVERFEDFPVTRLSFKFLNPKRRAEVLDHVYLVLVKKNP